MIKGYINTLIITMIVSQMSILLVPNKHTAKQLVKFICCISVSLCLIAPIRNIIVNVEEHLYKLKGVFAIEKDDVISGNRFDSSASVLTHYISENYGVEKENIKIIFVTSEDDMELTQIQIYFDNTDSAVGDRIEEFLRSELLVPIYIFVEE